MPFTLPHWMNRRAVLCLAALSACGEPKKPVATPAVAPAMTKILRVAALPLADSIAASYGLVAGFGADAMERPDQWLARWPVGKGWIPLMPGQLPGLRAWLTTDSLQAYTHGEEPRNYSFHLRYPAFAGPRAASLRRTVGRLSDLPEELAAVRRQLLYSDPAPRTPTGDEESEVFSDCQREETNTLDCYSLGASVLGADTVVSAAGTTYSIGHCVHGGAGRVTATYSLRQQRLLGFDDVFRPALRRALYHTVAGYVRWHQQKNWRANRRADRLPLMDKPSTGTGGNGWRRWPSRNASGKQFTSCADRTGPLGSIRRFRAIRLAASSWKPRSTSDPRGLYFSLATIWARGSYWCRMHPYRPISVAPTARPDKRHHVDFLIFSSHLFCTPSSSSRFGSSSYSHYGPLAPRGRSARYRAGR